METQRYPIAKGLKRNACHILFGCPVHTQEDTMDVPIAIVEQMQGEGYIQEGDDGMAEQSTVESDGASGGSDPRAVDADGSGEG